MEIEELDAAVYAIPTDRALEDATQSFDTLELVVVRVRLADRTEGMGITYTIGEGAEAIAAFTESVLRPLLVGSDPAPRHAYESMRTGTTFVGREGMSELAIAAVDIALWDAAARGAEEPLVSYLGGSHRSVPVYETHGGWLHLSREELLETASRVGEEGYAGMKMKLGRGHAEDERRVRAVREELPDRCELMLDANCGYTVDEAIRFTRRVSNLDLAWLEEPLEKDDYVGYATLRDRVEIPIATGENFYSPTAFKQVLALDAVDILQPDVCRVGGITPWVRVAELGAAWGCPVIPHYIEPIHLHLAAAVENVPYIEHHSTVLDRVMTDPPVIEDGLMEPAEIPGHGVRFEGIDQYRVSH